MHKSNPPARGRDVNPHVQQWVDECITLCQPARTHWCDGSEAERRAMFDRGVDEGVFIRLNQEKLPNCFLHRSHANDVARTEQLTFICTPGCTGSSTGA
jgi:phosphoenolpyruvate carboxykinase (GTP)